MNPEHLQRLQDLKADNDQTGRTMSEELVRFDRLKMRHIDGTAPRAVSAFNLFQTPDDVARRMAAEVVACVGENARILEPSAGLGNIYRALRAALPPLCRVVMVEESPDCCKELAALTTDNEGDRLFQTDFLSTMSGDLGGTFDAVCMNPPFKQGADVRHIAHALDMLNPGGVLVSLCYDGVRQNQWLKPRAALWEKLPPGTFRSAGTAADVVLLTMYKKLE